jgi:hypothetical protein
MVLGVEAVGALDKNVSTRARESCANSFCRRSICSRAGIEGSPSLKLPAAREGMGGTLPLGADLSAYVRAALPFAEQTMGGGTVRFPKLKVNEYVTFCARVTDASPEEVEKIQEEFEVRGRLAREAVDNHWRHVFAINPALRAAFEGLFPGYLAYVRSLRK